MKREIKFRIWIKQFMQRNPEMIYCNEDAKNTDIYFCTGNSVFVTRDDWYAGHEVQDVTSGVESIMEYTGMKDKNGKEIYEGDIICFKGTNRCYFVENVFDFHVWCYQNSIDTHLSHEIIGNLFENKNLLKTTQNG
jgi:hypothetical protein